MKYSVVVPVYNSMHTLYELVERITTTMMNQEHEIILVDDGSADESWEILKDIKGKYASSQITIIKLSKNSGQQSATLCGLKYANGDYAITIDDDLQVPPEEIPKLIQQIIDKNKDVVYGVYKQQQQSATRNMLRNTGYRSMETVNPLVNYTSSFRIINRRLLEYLSSHQLHFVSVDEVIQWYTVSIGAVEVNHQVRKNGDSGYSTWSLIRLSVYTLFNYYSFPLRFITSIGFYISVGSILLALYFIGKKLLFQVSVEGWTSLMVALLFSTGIIVFCLGIIGKYLFQIVATQNGKPPYVISEMQK